jgi:hypothetical protein
MTESEVSLFNALNFAVQADMGFLRDKASEEAIKRFPPVTIVDDREGSHTGLTPIG